MTAKKNENVRKSVIKNKFLEYVQTQKLVKSIDAMMQLYTFLFYEKKITRGNLY